MTVTSFDLRSAAALLLVAGLLSACGSGSGNGATSTPTTTSTPDSATTTTNIATATSPAPSTTTSSSATVELPDNLVVVGDWGSGTAPEGAVAGAMQRYVRDNDVAAILTTGDNFYSDDAEFLMQPYGWVAEETIDWWITWGNHDVESDSRVEAVNKTFDKPPRWGVHSWGAIDVIVLDSNQITSLEQGAFLLRAMAGSERPTVIVLHHPPYSCSHHGSTTEVVNQVIGIFDEDVFLVLSGHDHNYQRFENQDVTYVVTGGGGRSLYDLQECPANHPERLAGAELHHFLALQQQESSLQMTVFDVNGETIESLRLELP